MRIRRWTTCWLLAKERGEAPFLVILDGVTDRITLARSSAARSAQAHGVIIPERRAVGLTPAAVKASAGAVEYLPVAREVNLTRTIERLKKEGVWICRHGDGRRGLPQGGITPARRRWSSVRKARA